MANKNYKIEVLIVDKNNSTIKIRFGSGSEKECKVIAPAKIEYAKVGSAEAGFDGDDINYLKRIKNETPSPQINSGGEDFRRQIIIVRQNSYAHAVAIGAGTGMLSRHFIGRVKTVYLIEPNADMRQFAEETLQASTTHRILDGFAEAAPLPDNSIDLIVVGRAIHWFEPLKAKKEFLRITKPNGWLAILKIPCKDEKLVKAIKSIRTIENGWDVSRDKNHQEPTPTSFYFGHNNIVIQQYPDTIFETWQDFFGRLS